MKKLFTLLTLLLCVASSAWADEAIISWNMGEDGTDATKANSITGAAGCAAEGFAIAITGNSSKDWTAGNGSITYNSVTYKTLKNSNGAQNTITCPSGKVATQVVFYVTTNDTQSGRLSEIDKTTCDVEVTSHKDYDNPTVITKSIDNKSSFTFTFSTKQVCFIAVVTYTDAAPDVVANPVITQTGTSVTMTCNTSGAKVYYTIDGTEPTVNSNLYSEAVTLDNSCSVRAKAFNGDQNQYSSDAVKKDCYIDHSSEEGFVAVLGYDGGTVSGDVWTSTDAFFVLTNNVEGRGINYAGLSSGQDGFKLNHVDSYTLSAPDVKITKIVVVGKTWLQGDEGNASTIAFDGFTPTSGTFYDYPTNGETYVNTVEFTPEAELGYGATISMRPGNNQLGAYIEIYGVKRNGPADPIYSTAVTEIATINSDGTSNSVVTPNTYNAVISTSGNAKSTTFAGYNYGLKFESSNGQITISLPEGASNASITLLSSATFDKLKINGTNTDVVVEGDGTNGYTTTLAIADDYAGSNYTIAKGSGSPVIYIITLSYMIDNENEVTLTTTTTMQGWRAFYDASNSYTLDNNTKAYVATEVKTEESVSKVVLTEVAAVYQGAAVLLKTTNQTADGYSMTLTKDNTILVPDLLNQLKPASDATYNKVYRLGSKNGEVGFFPYAPEAGKPNVVVLNYDASNASGARGLTFSFADDETTAIQNVNGNDNVNKNVYDLQGRRVAKPTKGMYIVNGKKVIIK